MAGLLADQIRNEPPHTQRAGLRQQGGRAWQQVTLPPPHFLRSFGPAQTSQVQGGAYPPAGYLPRWDPAGAWQLGQHPIPVPVPSGVRLVCAEGLGTGPRPSPVSHLRLRRV